MNFLPGTPIDKSVADQIKLRQSLMGAENGFERQLYIQSQEAVPWARLTSAVKLEAPMRVGGQSFPAGYKLAEENRLFNFLNEEADGLAGYENTQLGYRPRPGIVDVQIHSHNRFGSLRTAVVRFQCWSKEQIDRLELLYMRPGYSLLLEWGWSRYAHRSTENGPIEIMQPETLVDLHQYTSGDALRRDLESKIRKSGYNYDAIYGLIKNFSWSFRPDGGYDCTTSIVTTGELVESYKANFYLSQKSIYDKINSGVDQYNENRELKPGYAASLMPPEFKGLELRYYRKDDEEVFQDENISLIAFRDEAKAKAQEVQDAIEGYILSATGPKVSAADFEVVTEGKTEVVSYKLIENFSYTPSVSLVKVRTNPVQFALKVNAGYIQEARTKVEELVNLSKGQLSIIESLAPTSVVWSSIADAESQGADVFWKKANENNSRSTIANSNSDLKLHRFWVLSYAPAGTTATEAEDGTTTTETAAPPTAAVTTYDPSYASLLHDVLMNDIDKTLEGKYGKVLIQASQMSSTQTFKEVFKYRDLPTIANTITAKLVQDNDRYAKILCGALKTASTTGNTESQKYTLNYIKLGMLLDILNLTLLRTASGEKLFTFTTKPFNDGTTPTYFTHDDQFSIDPNVCLLPHNLAALGIDHTPIVPVDKMQGISHAILDIEINVTYITSILDRFVSDRGRVAIYDLLEDIFSAIKRSTGGMMELELQFSERSASYSVVDRRDIGRPRREFQIINVYGKNSTVQNVNLVSRLTPKIASMVAISAQANAFTSTEEAAGFNALNKGLVDGIYPTKEDPVTAAADADSDYEAFLKELREELISTYTVLTNIYARRTYPFGLEMAVGDYENYCKFLNGKRFATKGSAFSFIIPFDLNLSLRGIGGLHVMQSFKIAKDILPDTYGGRANVAFMVTGLEHQINKQGWTTNIKTQIYNVDDNLNGPTILLSKTITEDVVNQAKGVTPTNTAWSAAFISYIVKKAGAGASFKYSQSHTGYAQGTKDIGNNNWEFLDPSTNMVEEGDIIIRNREGNTMRFSSNKWYGYSHGDIVTWVEYINPDGPIADRKAKVYSIGGNVGNKVKNSTTFEAVYSRVPVRDQFQFQWVLNKTAGAGNDHFVIIRPKNATVRDNMIKYAKEEKAFWTNYNESSPEVFNRLGEYWKTVGVTLKPD